MNDLTKFIRTIPDFPKPGIAFKDITPLLANAPVFNAVIEVYANHYKDAGLLPIFRNIEDIQSVIDTRAIPGMHLLVVGSLQNQLVLMALSYINPLAVWYVFILTIGIHIFTEVNKGIAFFVAIVIWLIRVSLDVVFVAAFLS